MKMIKSLTLILVLQLITAGTLSAGEQIYTLVPGAMTGTTVEIRCPYEWDCRAIPGQTNAIQMSSMDQSAYGMFFLQYAELDSIRMETVSLWESVFRAFVFADTERAETEKSLSFIMPGLLESFDGRIYEVYYIESMWDVASPLLIGGVYLPQDCTDEVRHEVLQILSTFGIETFPDLPDVESLIRFQDIN